MNRRYPLVTLFFLLFCGVLTQWAQTVVQIDSADYSNLLESRQADSVKLTMLADSLQQAKLEVATTQLELAVLRQSKHDTDSIERARLMLEIDKIRNTTKGMPVVIMHDTLFSYYSHRGGYSAQQRAAMAQEMIEKLGKRIILRPDSVYVSVDDNVTDVMYETQVIASFTDRDALWVGTTRDSLAMDMRATIVSSLKKLQNEHGLTRMLKRIGLIALILIVQIILIRLTQWLFIKVRNRIDRLRQTRFRPIKIKDYELLDVAKEVKLLHGGLKILKWTVIAIQLLISVPAIFAVFPATENVIHRLLEYIWVPVKTIFVGVVHYIPNLFMIAVIWLAIRYLVKFVRYLSKEIENERLKISGFYPDWARPTFNIVRFLLYAFMIAMIYPYLPGSDSGVFQGISVFIGLIISLGSSTVIGNIIAGMVITYMRPFRPGDKIKLDDTVGDIIEKTPLVTRIRTAKNEVVTVPNSFIMSSKSVNYTTSARQYGLILHTEVTIGYDVPWRQVHRLLIEAALATDGIVPEPKPFVLETSLNDWYPVYQLNAYTREPERMAEIYSQLHQNIQDHFNEAGVEIMSPTYLATRDGNASTVVTDPMK